MKILLTLCLVMCGLASHFVFAAECAHTITLLPQLRADRNQLNPGPVALSQYLVWREIADRPGVPVFTENVTEDVTADEERPAGERSLPKQIPSSFEKLSSHERLALVETGGDMAALNSGNTRELLAVMGGHDDLQKPVERASKALGEIKAYFSLNEDVKNVILVIGIEFRVDQMPDLFDPQCIETPSGLKELLAM